MCGRYVSTSTPDEIARYFDADEQPERALEASWNVAPTDDVYVVLERDDVRLVAEHHWGLVPFWAKSAAVGNKMINARADGLATKGAFKDSFARKRCIVPADGFYEWQRLPGQKVKQPYLITRRTGEPLAFAGLWSSWKPPGTDGSERLRSATIITTTPNDLMATIHDRMPVILPASAWDEWLDPANTDVDGLERLLVPAPSDVLTMRAVSTEVNNVRNQGAHLIDPIDPPAVQGQLLEPEAPGG
ncbi:SOS response-associated peptidase [Aquihabitans daechungensis]|uniref:SOS response-associated peptidase n=1 Tax=Aquihabitans daechungensis TaxID=1052257 RepID=UPI003B9F69AA